ncbi:cytochrome P450 [Halobacteriales archaeon QS_1_68_20]|nr:MAG: cytochrome P450 [Halobacteriales archaeon QS_1_68_20]
MSSSGSAAALALPPEAISSREGQLAPFGWYAEMRRDRPVDYDPQRQTWDVFRYEDVGRVLDDDGTFTADMTRAEVDVPDEASDGDDGESGQPLGRTMLHTDPPDHERLRGFAEAPFDRNAIRRDRPRFEALTEKLLDRLDDRSRIDLVGDFAEDLPVSIIAELLDVPADRRDRFRNWSKALIAHPDEETRAAYEETRDRQRRAYRELREYFSDLIDERTDGDDLVTLVANEADLDRPERVEFCILVLLAGVISTTSLVTNAVWCFAEHDAIDAVRSGEIDRMQAIEEVLRYRSPEQALRRVAVDDVELAGRQIEAGDIVTVWLGSANRDPDVFDAPDRFRPERHPNPHLAFGKGTHYCLGAPLARVEAEVAIEKLFERFRTIDPDRTDRTPLPTFPYHSLSSLPCDVERADG